MDKQEYWYIQLQKKKKTDDKDEKEEAKETAEMCRQWANIIIGLIFKHNTQPWQWQWLSFVCVCVLRDAEN